MSDNNEIADHSQRPELEPSPRTNGDMLRQMCDEELLDALRNLRELFLWDKYKALAWLSAPAESVKQNGNDDTQTDLCKADNAESEGEGFKEVGAGMYQIPEGLHRQIRNDFYAIGQVYCTSDYIIVSGMSTHIGWRTIRYEADGSRSVTYSDKEGKWE